MYKFLILLLPFFFRIGNIASVNHQFKVHQFSEFSQLYDGLFFSESYLIRTKFICASKCGQKRECSSVSYNKSSNECRIYSNFVPISSVDLVPSSEEVAIYEKASKLNH